MATDSKKNPAKRRGVKPTYSRGYKTETAKMVDLLVSRPFLTNAELIELTGYSNWCVRNCAGKARTIAKNHIRKAS